MFDFCLEKNPSKHRIIEWSNPDNSVILSGFFSAVAAGVSVAVRAIPSSNVQAGIFLVAHSLWSMGWSLVGGL